MMRLQTRAASGLGKGGGYFERSDPSDKKEEDLGPSVVDEFGRRKSDGDTTGRAAPSSGPRNGLTAVGPPLTKAERQKAALERLRSTATKKPTLSPPRTREYRKNHREVAAEKKQREVEALF